MGYVMLDDEDIEKIKTVEKMTVTDYEVKGNFVPVDSLMNMIYDLCYLIDEKNEEIEDIKQNIKDNYRQITVEEQVGVFH